ncbi:MAG: hypothetical protein JKY52_04695 [Flavobacteriales bacterium]|nr:hypothetical protein [Flavobacteriales bacterium]
MKNIIPALLIIGLLFNACGPSDKKLQDKKEEIESDAEEAFDDIMEMAEEASEEIEAAAEDAKVDTAAIKEDSNKMKKKLLGKLKKKK